MALSFNDLPDDVESLKALLIAANTKADAALSRTLRLAAERDHLHRSKQSSLAKWIASASRRRSPARQDGSRRSLHSRPCPAGTLREIAGPDWPVEACDGTHPTKNFAHFIIHVGLQGSNGNGTTIEVKFSRDHQSHPTHYQLTLKANPTSLLTGQNIWPAMLNFKSARHEIAFLLAWPATVVMSVCMAANVDFRPSASFRKAMLGDAVELMNMQFAGEGFIPEGLKQVALALLEDAYQTRYYPNVDKKLKPFRIGDLVRVKARGYESAHEIETTLLAKMSGDHHLASASFYDKGREQKLSQHAARSLGLKDQLRFDITLQKRGLNKLMSDSAQLARKNRVSNEMERFGSRSEYRTTAKNIINAIAMIDALYETCIDGKTYQGFKAWLMKAILFDEFHLDELFARSGDEVAKLDRLFEKLSSVNATLNLTRVC